MSNYRTHIARAAVIAAATLLAACEGSINVDFATEPPASIDVDDVVASIRGVEFRTSGGGTETVEFNDSESTSLMRYMGGDSLRLVTDEELSSGTYTGVRVLFDEEDDDNSYVLDLEGDDLPLDIVENDNYAAIDVTIDDEEDDEYSITLVMDLRQSLRESADNEYQLTPVWRAVDSDDASVIEGTAADNCNNDESFGEESAIYVYQGHDRTPDDRGGSGTQPYATAWLTFNSATEEYLFDVQFLPPGEYTVALACRGDREDPAEDDDLEFGATENVTLEDAETVSVEL